MNNIIDNKNRRVLIIDDNRSIHDDFRKIFSPATRRAPDLDASEIAVFGHLEAEVPHAQFDLSSAYQGQEGVLLVQNAFQAGLPFAVAFVDVRMPPGWDGVETTRRIWEIDPDLEIVLCTAYSDYSWGELFERLPHHDRLLILKKPFDAVEALQLASALSEKWWLRQQSLQKLEELESRVIERTGELRHTNHALQQEVIQHTRAEEELRWKTAFLEAQVNSSIDGILVVDQNQKTSLQNQRFSDLFKMPPHIGGEIDDEQRLRWAAGMIKNPAAFLEKVRHLYAHPEEISHDEIELKDGTILERHTCPAIGRDAKFYGRIWTFRDITERKSAEETLRMLSSAVQQSRESIVITDAQLDLPGPRILFVNPAFTQMTGYTAAEAIGRTPRILQGPRTDKSVLKRLRQNLLQGHSFAGEAVNYRKDGTEFIVEWQVAPIFTPIGKIVSISENGNRRQTGGRHRPRIQQHPNGHHRPV